MAIFNYINIGHFPGLFQYYPVKANFQSGSISDKAVDIHFRGVMVCLPGSFFPGQAEIFVGRNFAATD
jgi:hypothetical protein